jgi:hypothetical protein
MILRSDAPEIAAEVAHPEQTGIMVGVQSKRQPALGAHKFFRS